MEPSLPAPCLEKFDVERVLDSGGFGCVFLASHRALRRKVALKVLHAVKLQNPEMVERFLAEARMTAAVLHPHIVVLLDHGVDEGIPWIAYELLEGRCLREVLKDGPIAWEQAFKLGIQIASALEAAHARGIVHRDVKPANVLEAAPGHFKLTDFGVAKWLDREGVRTQDGIVVGSPVYASPEQIIGKDLGPHSDLYSLGILLYQCVTETVPFFHVNPQVIFAHHLKVKPAAPSTRIVRLPPAVDDVILKALAKKPEDRYPTATAMREALLETLGTQHGITVTHLRQSAGRGLPSTPSTGEPTAADEAPREAPREVPAAARPITPAALSSPEGIGPRGWRAAVLPIALVGAGILGVAMLARLWPRSSPLDGPRASPGMDTPSATPASEALGPSRPSKIPTARLVELSDLLRNSLEGLHAWDGFWDKLLADVGSNPVQANVGGLTAEVHRVLEGSLLCATRIDAVADQVARPYEGPARMPTGEMALWTRALAYRFVNWTRVERLKRMEAEFGRAAREGRTGAQELYLIGSQVSCGARGVELLGAYLGGCALVLDRDLGDDGLTGEALADALRDEFLVSQTIVFTHWDPGVGEAITGDIGRFKARLLHLDGADSGPVAGMALAFWEWGRGGVPRGIVRTDLAHAADLARSLAGRHPEARRAMDGLAHEMQEALAHTHPQGH